MKRILVVDDDPAIGRLARLGLESSGDYKVFTENIGSRAVASAKQCRPDLILLDIMMPGMDGSEVAAALREDPELNHIKMVFLTSLLRKGERNQSGEHPVIGKPVTAQELVAIIEQELGEESSG